MHAFELQYKPADAIGTKAANDEICTMNRFVPSKCLQKRDIRNSVADL